MKRVVQSTLVAVGVFASMLIIVIIVGGMMLTHGTPMDANGIQIGPPTNADQVATMSYIGAAAGIVLGIATGVMYWRRK